MTGRHFLSFSLAAALPVMWCGCGARAGSSSAAPPESAATVTVVPAARAARATLASSTVLTAEFQPYQEIEVMAKVAGYVRSIKVDIGDRVREGQVIAELEVPEMNDELAKSSAVVDQASSELVAARDDQQRAEAAHQIAHLSYTRLVEVSQREKGLIPQQEIDESHARDLVAEAQLSATRSRLKVDENKMRVAKAEETRMKTLKNYVTIAAPFSGTITRRYANLGAMVQAGISSQSQAMPLVRLSQLSTLRLSLPVPESLVPSIRQGQAVEVKVKSLNQSITGKVSRTSSRVDPSTRTMITEVDIPNASGKLVPGMYAEVALETAKHNDVLTVPLDAVERAGSATRVYIAAADGTVRVAPVQLGIEDARRAEILSGIAESDVVITGRKTGLKPGDRVQPNITEVSQ